MNSCLVRFKALASYAYRDPSVPGQGRSGKPCGRAAAGYGERVLVSQAAIRWPTPWGAPIGPRNPISPPGFPSLTPQLCFATGMAAHTNRRLWIRLGILSAIAAIALVLVLLASVR